MGIPPTPAISGLGSPLQRVRVILVSPSHPGNVGSVARAMKTMGLTDLTLVTPRDAQVLSSAEAIALASGATDVLGAARIASALAEALADTHFALAFTSRRRELSHGVVPLRDAARTLAAGLGANAGARAALVFGSETFGLSNEEVDRCQAIATIPANADYASLNLSHAVQLAAYEVRMACGAADVPVAVPREIATTGAVDGFLDHLTQAAVESGFLDPAAPKRFDTRMRRLFSRARMEPEEVAILRGLLAALLARRRKGP
ncbi:MAG: RNA methyltransferase [Betaproteobacteria bacterium]|nr:RNA methyltransferase [Betaproteobacteria bacterium]